MNATYVGLFGLLTFGMGALITGLWWAAAYARLERRCDSAERERNLYITFTAEARKAHAQAVDDLIRNGIGVRLRSVK